MFLTILYNHAIECCTIDIRDFDYSHYGTRIALIDNTTKNEIRNKFVCHYTQNYWCVHVTKRKNDYK